MGDIASLIPLMLAFGLGGGAVLLAVPALMQYQRERKTRLLRGMVKDAGAVAGLSDDADPIALAKRRAEEAALLDQLQAAVARLKPPAG